ncbi:MAG: dihydrolipoyl dehydrogenase [Gammaproteobacteria bacterium]|nr:dihydrolipoyl dehydrogenase [Gammaproteobacteria bacterium]MCW8924496.1 dihydrolipoyl dehydrogenase [Gammaproteobacteria bacterium]
MSREVDVAIIGAGSAGLFALSQVRKQTDSFVLIDGGELGTTCARVGCMPSKALIQVAEDFHRRKVFEREGIEGADSLKVDVPEAMEHVQDLRDTFVDRTLGATDHLDEAHLLESYARFTSNDTLEVDGEEIRAKKIIIATGTTPIVPAAWQDVAENVITTDEFFELEDLPATMAVIGLGSIGLEIGQALSRLGVDVTGMDQLETVAKLADPVVGDLAVDAISKEFPLWLGAMAELEPHDEGVKVTCGDKSVVVEKVLASLGRRPNLDQLGLENVSIELDERGIPVYDPHTMQVGDSSIFIAGDVNADRALLHEAGHEGRVAGYNTVHDITAFKRKTPLGITFCEPSIATVGEQLDELNDAEIAIGEIQFGPVGRALIMAKNRGVLRVYANKADGRLRGAAMACVKAENLAHLLAWSIQQGLSVQDLLKMPFYHPVIEEALQAALYDALGKLDVSEEVVELEKL